MTSMDRQFKVVKTDYIVPGDSGSLRTSTLTSNVPINVLSSVGTALSLAASHLGSLVYSTDSNASATVTLPTASAVSTYWGAAPGDAYNMTVINAALTAGTLLFSNTTVGLITAATTTLTVASAGNTRIVEYVMGGTLSVPTAVIFIH